ncbi:MAG TPA: hypothetical protein PKM39_09500 [Pseudothauera hydrothermalis]|jgi:hypothetical protein|uniref:hypothetical protein n=1 Tax=Pseudothauera hydrothermalis TaxID=2184083 RepID=UPI00131585B5|nr:hypothetical protein [Pseudothauera hydrothermalis]HNQ76857.1 hypothetical protein [Pseudothauera hydrothermalis]
MRHTFVTAGAHDSTRAAGKRAAQKLSKPEKSCPLKRMARRLTAYPQTFSRRLGIGWKTPHLSARALAPQPLG